MKQHYASLALTTPPDPCFAAAQQRGEGEGEKPPPRFGVGNYQISQITQIFLRNLRNLRFQ